MKKTLWLGRWRMRRREVALTLGGSRYLEGGRQDPCRRYEGQRQACGVNQESTRIGMEDELQGKIQGLGFVRFGLQVLGVIPMGVLGIQVEYSSKNKFPLIMIPIIKPLEYRYAMTIHHEIKLHNHQNTRSRYEDHTLVKRNMYLLQ